MANTQKKSEGSPSTLFSEDASKPVSRVLSFKTAIYLDAPLPVRSSRLPGTVGPTKCPSTALLRIEFTATDAWHAVGRALTSAFPPLPRRRKNQVFAPAPFGGTRRFISVALFLGSPPAGVTRYPCPVEPGLSSQAGLSPRPRGCPAYLRRTLYLISRFLSNQWSAFD